MSAVRPFRRWKLHPHCPQQLWRSQRAWKSLARLAWTACCWYGTLLHRRTSPDTTWVVGTLSKASRIILLSHFSGLCQRHLPTQSLQRIQDQSFTSWPTLGWTHPCRSWRCIQGRSCLGESKFAVSSGFVGIFGQENSACHSVCYYYFMS